MCRVEVFLCMPRSSAFEEFLDKTVRKFAVCCKGL